jgi:predicted Zn finger-like uncharacterized protein
LRCTIAQVGKGFNAQGVLLTQRLSECFLHCYNSLTIARTHLNESAMRLVCPNCDAEYEVDASAIPEGGRDVQCSNCGHAWFQVSPELEAEIAEEEALYEPPPPRAAEPEPEFEPEPAEPEPAEPEPEPEVAAKPANSIDASVLAVLREEAEREIEARKAEAPVMETQTDMALIAPAAAAGGMSAVARRLARLKGVEPEAARAKPAIRSESFPAIEEINSTLRSSSEKRSGAQAAVAETMGEGKQGSSGFRSGFVLMLVLAVLGVALYVMAPKLAEQLPAAAGALQAYVVAVDAARLTLDGWMQSAIGFLHGLAGGQS